MDEFPGGSRRGTQDNPSWRKSSKSVNGGHCVEVAYVDGYVLVRDSKDSTGPQLKFHSQDWDTFIKSVKGRD
jgi:hypothetical protein